jgi:hypothetical protein
LSESASHRSERAGWLMASWMSARSETCTYSCRKRILESQTGGITDMGIASLVGELCC